MKCPECKGKTEVYRTQHSIVNEESIYREHKCRNCGAKFYSVQEIIKEEEREIRSTYEDLVKKIRNCYI